MSSDRICNLVLFSILAFMLALGAHADTDVISGETPLMEAVRHGDIRKISGFLELGVDVNKRNSGGVTALMLAAASGRMDIAELLLEAGARPDINDYQGSSAADRAEQGGYSRLARLLKERSKLVNKNRPIGGYDFADDAFVDISHPEWFKDSFLDLREDLSEARSEGKLGIILFLSSRRCSYCKVFLERVLSVPEIKHRVQSNYDVIGLEIFSDLEMIDADGQSYRVNEFVTRMKASYTPTIIIYGNDGSKLVKLVGYYPRDKFERVLDYLEDGHYLREPLREYLARTEAYEPSGTAEINVDSKLFRSPPYILDRRVARADRPLFVLFERSNCESCERLHKNVLSDKSIRNLLARFEAIQLNISDSADRVLTPEGSRITARQWYQNLNLNYSPAMIFFDEAGKEVMRLDSETLRYRMEGSLQLVLEKAYENDAQLQRWRRTKAIEAIQRND